MSIVQPHTFIRQRPQRVDDGHGGTESDWSLPPDELAIPGWGVDAGDTLEDLQNREGTSVDYTAYGPVDADVRGGDRIKWSGMTFEVNGGVLRQFGATPNTSNAVVRLRYWEG